MKENENENENEIENETSDGEKKTLEAYKRN